MCVPRRTVTISYMQHSLEQHATNCLDTQLFKKQDNNIQSQFGTFCRFFSCVCVWGGGGGWVDIVKLLSFTKARPLMIQEEKTAQKKSV